jgi:hypothetical protein
MEVLISITSIGIYTCLFILIIGIYKPWVALWWMEKQNRKLVLAYYGTSLIILILIKYLVVFFLPEAS